MDWLISNWSEIIQIALAIVGAASLIAKLTPTEVDNRIIDVILKILHSIALNPRKSKARRR
jgi:hypothetical protein